MANNPFQGSAVQRPAESIFAQNKVLRNTYALLSMTLIFSGLMAVIAMAMNVSPGIGMAATIAGFISLFVVMALRNSPWGLLMVFVFTGLWGFGLGPMLSMYIAAYANGGQLIMTALGGTGVIFLGLSAYVLTTKKNFNFMGGMLFSGVIAILIASIIGIFVQAPMLQIIISAAVMLVFSGFILFDTSRIIHGGETNYIMATVSLFINIVNIFLALLRLLAAFSGNRN
tara:strand:- start:12157 stop:12840 length:684 start_codon:yes stop_codon:yes gene_type:complete